MSDAPMTTLHATLRQLAEEHDPARRMELFDLLASQLAVQFNQQANNAQVALWRAQETARADIEYARAATDKKIDRVNEQVGDTNILLTEVIKALAELRGVVEILDLRDQAQWAEGEIVHAESRADRAELRAALEALDARVSAAMARISPEDSARYTAVIEEAARRFGMTELGGDGE